MDQRNHQDVMADAVPLDGATVLDIGCGNGRVTRLIAACGAAVIGIDPGPRQIERARAEAKVNGEAYVMGAAEELPIAEDSTDVVFFFNSLHHVPEALMDRALREAHRVLKPRGWLYVAEPLAEGPQFELQRPYNDETEVRAKAYAAVRRADGHGFAAMGESTYVADGRQENFEAWRENSLSVSPGRAKLFAEHDAELRARFTRYGEKRADGWHFPNPIRVNLLRKS